MKNFWKRTLFWDRVRNSLAIFGMPSGALAAYVEMNPTWLLISAISGALIALMAVWFTDSDKNGVVDLFE
jgi:hypothetical protein